MRSSQLERARQGGKAYSHAKCTAMQTVVDALGVGQSRSQVALHALWARLRP